MPLRQCLVQFKRATLHIHEIHKLNVGFVIVSERLVSVPCSLLIQKEICHCRVVWSWECHRHRRGYRNHSRCCTSHWRTNIKSIRGNSTIIKTFCTYLRSIFPNINAHFLRENCLERDNRLEIGQFALSCRAFWGYVWDFLRIGDRGTSSVM